jgi:hypothetical protein
VFELLAQEGDGEAAADRAQDRAPA